MFVFPLRKNLVGVAELPMRTRLGLCNQLNAILCFIIANHKTPYRSIVIKGFYPHLFENKTCPLSTILDLKYANKALSSFGMPTLLDYIPRNAISFDISALSEKNKHIEIDVNTLPRQYTYLYSVICPAKNIRKLAISRLPSKIKQFDAILLKFGVDEIIHYLGTLGSETLPNYQILVHGSNHNKKKMLDNFNTWANSPDGIKALNKYTNEAISFIDKHFECNKPIYVCTAVGKDRRHDVMIPYIERVIKEIPCLTWNRDIPDERREICAMIDLCMCVASSVHYSYPTDSTLSAIAQYIKLSPQHISWLNETFGH